MQGLVESRLNPSATSEKGASGISQFIPSTAKMYGVIKGDSPEAIQSQIDGQAHYMSDLLKKYDGDKVLATLAYNQGPGNVTRWLRGEAITKKFKNPAGRDYVKQILSVTLPIDGRKYKRNNS